jgi:hypothetical protein
MTTAADIAAQLGAACRSGRWWRRRCPIHNSQGATLALRDGDRGLIAVCHAGCPRPDILAELRQRELIAGRSERDRLASVMRPSDERTDVARRVALALRIWRAAKEARVLQSTLVYCPSTTPNLTTAPRCLRLWLGKMRTVRTQETAPRCRLRRNHSLHGVLMKPVQPLARGCAYRSDIPPWVYILCGLYSETRAPRLWEADMSWFEVTRVVKAGGPTLRIKALNVHLISGNGIIAIADPQVPAWNITLQRCRWRRQKGRDRVGLPCNGIVFQSDGDAYRFQQVALTAMRTVARRMLEGPAQ